ncbi:iron ABC transporter permease [Myxococcota bacterium]|nr:iron ABC transporter permease [Myxococcota bacterium]
MNSLVWQIRSRAGLVLDPALAWTLVFALGLVVAALLAATQGAVELELRDLLAAVRESTHPLHRVVWDVRLPRAVCAALVGLDLALAGALLQTAVRNPLADPGVLGVTAGAGVGALCVILFFPESSQLVPWAAFAGGLAAIAAIIALVWSRPGQTGALRIVLTGVSLQAILFALIALLTFAFADRAPAFAAFMVGSLNGAGWSDAGRMLIPSLVGVAGIAASMRTLNALLLDDGAASGLGVSVLRARFLAACIAALLTAAAVSAAGLVGFVGLVVPNGLRLVVGPEHMALLPATALAGASLVLIADTIARTSLAPLELPVGALLALVGGPYFLFILWKKLP